MSVHVTLAADGHGNELHGEDIDTGQAVFVSDGHLFVTRSSGNHANQIGNTVATYAPGKWVRAQVGQAEAS